MPQLTNPRHEALAQGLAAGKGTWQAYSDAGFTGRSKTAAHKASYHPDVQVRKAELIRERHEIERKAIDKAIEQESITKAYAVTRLKFLADRGIRGTIPVYDSKGEQTGWRPTGSDTAGAVRSLEILCRIGGFLVDKVEIGQPGDFARLSDDELTKELILVGESIGIDTKQIQKAITGSTE